MTAVEFCISGVTVRHIMSATLIHVARDALLHTARHTTRGRQVWQNVLSAALIIRACKFITAVRLCGILSRFAVHLRDTA